METYSNELDLTRTSILLRDKQRLYLKLLIQYITFRNKMSLTGIEPIQLNLQFSALPFKL